MEFHVTIHIISIQWSMVIFLEVGVLLPSLGQHRVDERDDGGCGVDSPFHQTRPPGGGLRAPHYQPAAQERSLVQSVAVIVMAEDLLRVLPRPHRELLLAPDGVPVLEVVLGLGAEYLDQLGLDLGLPLGRRETGQLGADKPRLSQENIN